jgi:hypothetical protein
MKLLNIIVFSTCTFLLVSVNCYASEEFFGLLESRPQGKTGTWVIGGRQVEVAEKTEIEEEEGPFVVGACIEVEYEGKVVKVIGGR